MTTTDDLMKAITILNRKISDVELQLKELHTQNGHISAELQRLRQIINKGVK